MEATRVKKVGELRQLISSSVGEDRIEPPLPVPGGFSQELITGVGKPEDRLVILLNPDAILTADEKMALSRIDAATAIERATH